ncbi:unnamed protein product, partial [Polarella glacialis]
MDAIVECSSAARSLFTTTAATTTTTTAATTRTTTTTPATTTTLFVKKLPASCTESDLHAAFGAYGRVSCVKLLKGRRAFVDLGDCSATGEGAVNNNNSNNNSNNSSSNNNNSSNNNSNNNNSNDNSSNIPESVDILGTPCPVGASVVGTADQADTRQLGLHVCPECQLDLTS